jgi:arsenical pump membrane protein
MLHFTQKKFLHQSITAEIEIPQLSSSGRAAAYGIVATAAVLLIASAFDVPLGLPTAITGIITSVIVLIIARKKPGIVIKNISWSILPLVAGLFVIVEALDKTGLIYSLSKLLTQQSSISPNTTALCSGIGIAVVSNLTNNLPSGLIAGSAVQAAAIPTIIKNAVLIGIDLGPNLSVTGSLATILWLVALRREGHEVTPWQFLKLGMVVMIPALLLALAALWI